MQQFIRDSKPNLTQYIPEFMRTDETIKNVLQAESNEHEKERLMLIDILNQFFVDSSTWGLDKYEEILDIKSNANLDFTQRRNQVLLKLQTHNTSTVDYMIKLVKRYMSENAEVTIQEYNNENRFTIVTKNGSINYSQDMINAIDTYKPAHLAYRILLQRVLDMTDNSKISVGLINSKIGRQKIDIPKPPACNTGCYSGCVNAKVGRQTVNIAHVPVFNSKLQTGIYNVKRGRIEIGGIK